MAEIVIEKVAVTTTGSDGVATGSAASGAIHGKILDIYLDYHASAPAGTTDITIAYTTRGGNIYAKTDNVTDVLVHPRAKPVDNAASAITNALITGPCNLVKVVGLVGLAVVFVGVGVTVFMTPRE